MNGAPIWTLGICLFPQYCHSSIGVVNRKRVFSHSKWLDLDAPFTFTFEAIPQITAFAVTCK